MKEKIIETLASLEKEENIQILYACESGSRAWGFPSRDSDYDVRFIYIRPVSWYLSINPKRDVIELPINDSLDINGWDLQKALRLLRKSNPPLMEWLSSPIVYQEKTKITQRLRDLSGEVFSPKASMYHYLSMAKGNFREYLQGETVRAKKYFYVLRPLLACKWISLREALPPIEFDKLMELMPSGPIKAWVEGLLERKKAGEELDSEPRIATLNEYIQAELAFNEKLIRGLGTADLVEEEVFDRFFQEALKEAWRWRRFR